MDSDLEDSPSRPPSSCALDTPPSFCALHTLPPELLASIFHLVVLKYRLFTIYYVSKHWMRILEDDSSFWTDVWLDVSQPQTINTLERYLTLSKDKHIDVFIRLQYPSWGPWNIPESVDVGSLLASALSALVATSRRWKSFCLHGVIEAEIALAIRALIGVEIPQLETLEMTDNLDWIDRIPPDRVGFTRRPGEEWPRLFDANSTPKLTSVRVDQRMFCHGSPPLAGLLALHIGISAGEDSAHVLQMLVDTSRTCPRLQCLSLDLLGVTPAPVGVIQGLTTLSLPALLYLHIENVHLLVLVHLLNVISPRSLKSLHLTRVHVDKDNVLWDALAGLSPRDRAAFGRVQSITLRDCSRSCSWSVILNIFPAVRYLTLYWCDDADMWTDELGDEVFMETFPKLETLGFLPLDTDEPADEWCTGLFLDMARVRKEEGSLKCIRVEEGWDRQRKSRQGFLRKLRDIVDVSMVETWDCDRDHEVFNWSDGSELGRMYERETDIDDWAWHVNRPW